MSPVNVRVMNNQIKIRLKLTAGTACPSPGIDIVMVIES